MINPLGSQVDLGADSCFAGQQNMMNREIHPTQQLGSPYPPLPACCALTPSVQRARLSSLGASFQVLAVVPSGQGILEAGWDLLTSCSTLFTTTLLAPQTHNLGQKLRPKVLPWPGCELCPLGSVCGLESPHAFPRMGNLERVWEGPTLVHSSHLQFLSYDLGMPKISPNICKPRAIALICLGHLSYLPSTSLPLVYSRGQD